MLYILIEKYNSGPLFANNLCLGNHFRA